jgi:hypothetical protein
MMFVYQKNNFMLEKRKIEIHRVFNTCQCCIKLAIFSCLGVDYTVRFSCPTNRLSHPSNRLLQRLAHQCRMLLRQTVCRT